MRKKRLTQLPTFFTFVDDLFEFTHGFRFIAVFVQPHYAWLLFALSAHKITSVYSGVPIIARSQPRCTPPADIARSVRIYFMTTTRY